MENKIVITREEQPEHFTTLMQILEDKLKVNGCGLDFTNLKLAFDEFEKNSNIAIDRELTTSYMIKNGGYCDCEIMLNLEF